MRKLMSLALALVLSLALAAPAAAADVGTSGSTGAVPVTISAEATTFSVTVPTSIPLNVDANAAVTCANNLKIINNSAGPVEVTGISVQNSAWSIVSFNGGNRSSLASEKVNSNKLGLALKPSGGTQIATSATGNQNITLKDGEWVIPAGGNLPFECAGIATAVSASASNVEAAKVVFTLAWKAVEYTISMDELTGHYVSTNYNGNTINIIVSQQWFEDYGSAHNMTSDELIEVMKQGGTSSTFNDEPFENFEENWDMLTISFRYAGDGTYRFENNTLHFYFVIEVAMV